ncbi:MAG TPA: MarR family transcriptional regulator [Candidatus Nitrosotalea sp.]|nr:MarR family transcriptional regulator [Candidatus Nitrosotalea sp.]
MRDLTIIPRGHALAQDQDGRLYDPVLRGALQKRGQESVAALEAAIALRQAARRLHLWMERWAEEHGFSEGRLHVLIALHHSPGHRIALGRLAADLDVVPRTVTGLVDHLERDGLVERVHDTEDRRSVYAQLTRLGQERIDAIRQQAVARESAFTLAFDEGELAELRHLCLRVSESLGDPGAFPPRP